MCLFFVENRTVRCGAVRCGAVRCGFHFFKIIRCGAVRIFSLTVRCIAHYIHQEEPHCAVRCGYPLNSFVSYGAVERAQ